MREWDKCSIKIGYTKFEPLNGNNEKSYNLFLT